MVEEEARCEVLLGIARRRAGDSERGLRHSVKALELLAGAPPSARVDAIVEIGRCHRAQGDVRYSIHVLESFLDEMRRTGLTDPRAVMLTNAALVGSYLSADLFHQAAAAGERAERLTPQVSDPHEVANLHITMAQLLTHQGFRDEALRSLRRAETIYEGLDWSAQLAYAKLAKGIALADSGDNAGARTALLEVLGLLTKLPHKTEKAQALNELARLERSEGNIPRALELLHESQDVLAGTDCPQLAQCYLEIGLCERETDPSAAEKRMKVALDIYRRIGIPSGQADVLRALGDLLTERGEPEEAVHVYREGIVIATEAVRL
jgi:tetratricopeptide (TPR) repeat protein